MIDPHEGGARVPQYAKELRAEDFLVALNKHLIDFDYTDSGVSSIDAASLPIIYIVGAPRSGTTLLSQAVSRYLPIGYINNLLARFWDKPSVGVRLSELLLGHDSRELIQFESKHGVTDGPSGPHEFGYFWSKHFGLNKTKTHHLSHGELFSVDRLALRTALRDELLTPFNRPIVFKNVICGFQAPLLTNVHEKSLFIHITRNLRSTVASILKSRFERYGSYATWWSLKPSTFFELPEDPVEQVLQQVIDCRREIDAQIDVSGARAIRVSYEDFCLEPNRLLQNICEVVGELGYSMTPYLSAPNYSASRCPRLPVDLLNRIDVAIAQRSL